MPDGFAGPVIRPEFPGTMDAIGTPVCVLG